MGCRYVHPAVQCTAFPLPDGYAEGVLSNIIKEVRQSLVHIYTRHPDAAESGAHTL